MKTKGALLWELNQEFPVDEIPHPRRLARGLPMNLLGTFAPYMTVHSDSVVKIDPVASKRDQAIKFGATHVLFLFTMLQKTLKGNIFGGGNSHIAAGGAVQVRVAEGR